MNNKEECEQQGDNHEYIITGSGKIKEVMNETLIEIIRFAFSVIVISLIYTIVLIKSIKCNTFETLFLTVNEW